jgi:hypothetical protein
MDIEEVVERIETGFGEGKYPGDDHLTQGSSMEDVEVRDFLRGRRWQDLSVGELARNHASLFFMTSEAIRYYLPAFLIASVRHYDDSDQIPSSLLFLLNPFAINDSDYQSHFRERFKSLNESEKSAIEAFLKYLHDFHAEDFPAVTNQDQASQLLEWWTTREP